MKTRQQKLAEERAGHPPSPPQSLPMNQRGPRRARSKTPSATAAAGSVVPAAQSAALVEPQALLRVWVDVSPELSGRPVKNPTHQVAFASSLLPEVVEYLNNIRDPSKENPTTYQEIREQGIEEAIEPKEPEPVTAGKPTKRRKNAFRRNPLMGTSAGLKSQPVPAFVDTSAADGIPMIFRSDFIFAANSQGDDISQQPEEKLPANENSRIVDVSESGGTIGTSAEFSHQAAAPQGNLAPDTPRGRRWGLGGLLESARSITRRLGFGPLASVPESPEAFSQTAPTSAPLAVTESTAPAHPKKKSSAPSSARDSRAKSRLHKNSAVKSSSKSLRNKRSRAKRGDPTSSETEAIGAEDEGFPAMKSIHPENHEEDTRQAGVGEPTARPAIRWPSRSLDRMNVNKRKRWGDPLDTPGTDAGSDDRGAIDIDRVEGGAWEEQAVKRRRTGEPGELTSQVAGHPSAAQPSAVEWQGGNVFAEDQAARKVANAGRHFLPKTPIPITNRTGTFKVPSPGDSDWSDSGSDEDESEGDKAGLEEIAPSRTNNGRFVLEGTGKPRQTLRPSESEALRKAQEKSQKHKPRKPSRLSHSIKAYPSPSPPASERQGEPSGGKMFTAFEDWCKTAPPAVAAAIEKMEVDSNMAGNAAEAALLENHGPGRRFQHTAYEAWCRTAPPAVTAVLENMEIHSNIAGQAFMSGLDKFIEQQ